MPCDWVQILAFKGISAYSKIEKKNPIRDVSCSASLGPGEFIFDENPPPSTNLRRSERIIVTTNQHIHALYFKSVKLVRCREFRRR